MGELVKIKRNQTMCPMMLQRVKLLKIKRNQTMCPMMIVATGFPGYNFQKMALVLTSPRITVS